MTETEWQDGDAVSLFAVGTTLLQNRWRIVRWMFIGAAMAALSVISKPALYLALASFIPKGSDAASRSGLASLAGQFGVSLPANTSRCLLTSTPMSWSPTYCYGRSPAALSLWMKWVVAEFPS